MIRSVRAIAVSAGLSAGAAAAQGWETGSFDNGSWFEATAMAPGGQVALHCGGPSPGRRPLPESDEPMLTEPGMLELWINLPALADPTDGLGPPRRDLAVVVGSTGYRLPEAYWDVINGRGWIVAVPEAEPWLAALGAAPAFAVDSAAGRHAVIPADGAGRAIAAVVDYCRARRQAPAPAPAPAASARDLLLRGVEAAVAETCGGASRRNPGWLLEAEIDGDGTGDLLLVWAENECMTATSFGMCAPSQCPIDIFLSSRFPVPGQRESIMGNLVGVVPRAGQGAAIRVVSPPNCSRAADPAVCAFDWVWTGSNMAVLE